MNEHISFVSFFVCYTVPTEGVDTHIADVLLELSPPFKDSLATSALLSTLICILNACILLFYHPQTPGTLSQYQQPCTLSGTKTSALHLSTSSTPLFSLHIVQITSSCDTVDVHAWLFFGLCEQACAFNPASIALQRWRPVPLTTYTSKLPALRCPASTAGRPRRDSFLSSQPPTVPFRAAVGVRNLQNAANVGGAACREAHVAALTAAYGR